MNTMTESDHVNPPRFLVDNRSNLVIDDGMTALSLNPVQAIELIKFIERIGYQAQANAVIKGAPQ